MAIGQIIWYIVFPSLAHTLGLGPDVWRVLDKAHRIRNSVEYEGALEVSKQMVVDLLKAAEMVQVAVEKIGPVSTTTPGQK